MLSRFFGNSDKSDDSPSKEASGKGGIEVIEDDPDAAWRAWDSALLAQADDDRVQIPGALPEPAASVPILKGAARVADFSLPTEPMPLDALTPEQRKNKALNTVERYHLRIGNTIRTLWGYTECGVYINKLIMSGGDGMGHARVGFNQEAVQAMLELSDLHDAEFGRPETSDGVWGLSN
jgi:hypothetical protein